MSHAGDRGHCTQREGDTGRDRARGRGGGVKIIQHETESGGGKVWKQCFVVFVVCFRPTPPSASPTQNLNEFITEKVSVKSATSQSIVYNPASI